MPDFDLNTLEGRLAWAIDRRPKNGRRRGKNDFMRAMEEYESNSGIKIKGITAGSLADYLRPGRTAPSVPFLKAAAHVCGVRSAWLIMGEGEPTEPANAAMRATPSGIRSYSPRSFLFQPRPGSTAKQLRKERNGPQTTPGNWDPVWSPDVPQTLMGRLIRRFPQSELESFNDIRLDDLGSRLARAFMAPLEELGVDLNDFTQDEFEDFEEMMVPPMLVLARMRRRLWDEAAERAEEMEQQVSSKKKSRSIQKKRRK